jgi:DNA polymerase I
MNHLIVDGYNLAFRSHFAFNTLMTNKGLLSGCVYGFLVSLRTVKNKYPHAHVTIAWDTDSTRRKSIDASYKSNRPHFSATEQINDLKGIFSNLNVSQAEYAGEEADDVIASLIKKYQDDTNQIYIYSADKDLLQLVEDGKVIAIHPKKGSKPEKILDEAAVKEEFGVWPRDLQCYQCFRGDSVDNVPGVPNLRISCVIPLIEKYHTPQEVYAHLGEQKLTDFQRASLEASEQRVYLNQGLVALRNDLELEIKTGTPNEEALAEYLSKYEIRAVNSNSYVNVYYDAPSFGIRTAPAIKSYSLFDEEAE